MTIFWVHNIQVKFNCQDKARWRLPFARRTMSVATASVRQFCARAGNETGNNYQNFFVDYDQPTRRISPPNPLIVKRATGHANRIRIVLDNKRYAPSHCG